MPDPTGMNAGNTPLARGRPGPASIEPCRAGTPRSRGDDVPSADASPAPGNTPLARGRQGHARRFRMLGNTPARAGTTASSPSEPAGTPPLARGRHHLVLPRCGREHPRSRGDDPPAVSSVAATGTPPLARGRRAATPTRPQRREHPRSRGDDRSPCADHSSDRNTPLARGRRPGRWVLNRRGTPRSRGDDTC